jgi:hypothetical protein
MNSSRPNLRKAFMTALMTTAAAAGAATYAPPAEAAMKAATSAAAIAARGAARRHRMDEATVAAILNPSDANIQTLVDRGVITAFQAPYAKESAAALKMTNGGQVTESVKSAFISSIEMKLETAIMAAATPAEAVGKGLSSGLSPYFNECKASYKNVPELAIHCMEGKHWENDTKPLLKEILGGGLLLGLGMAVGRRR